MILRNAVILLTLMMCLTFNFYAQNFYYGSDGKVELEIFKQKILVKFKSKLNVEEQRHILSKQENYLDLENVQQFSTPQVSIIALKNTPNDDSLKVLLQSLRNDKTIEYANYFLANSDGTLNGITDRIFLKLKSADQVSLLDQIIFDFQGVTAYTRSSVDELLFEIKVHKNRNAVALANEIHEYEIFDYCEPDFFRVMNKLATDELAVLVEE